MENYGNTAVKVLGRFHAFLHWKDKVYKQVFYITDCDRSPNLLSRDACYTLGVLKPCYTVEKQLEFSENSTHSTQSQATPIHASKSDTKIEQSFLHQKMKGTVRKLSNNSTKHSISKEQLQGGPLTKQDILDVYVMFSPELGSFQDYLTSSNLNQMQNPLDMHLGKCQYTCRKHSMRKSGIWKH